MALLSGLLRSFAPQAPVASRLTSFTPLAASSIIRSFASDSDINAKLKRFPPKTPSLRHLVQIDRSELWQGRPLASLTLGKRKSGGRGKGGMIAVRHRGGGHRRLLRFVDFKRVIMDEPGTVERLEYDPNRSAYIALVSFPGGRMTYILAPKGLQPGDAITASRTKELDVKPGNAMPLAFIPVGTIIHNLELIPGHGGQIARSAGTFCQLMDKGAKPGYGLVRLVSKEQRLINLNCLATIGEVSNAAHQHRKLGKAGRARWLGWRPTVRGTAMNPVDHPMGGGQGKTSGGRPSCSPSGKLAKGKKTRSPRKKNRFIVVRADGKKNRMAFTANE